jgi:Protein of unknown function (DUF4038)/Putative collagen-binding domain of a collagenase
LNKTKTADPGTILLELLYVLGVMSSPSRTFVVFRVLAAVTLLLCPSLAAYPLNDSSGTAIAAPAYPVKKGPTGRYLVDQNNVPFLIAGESPQAMIGNLSEADAELFFQNRKGHGFNTVWINLLCNEGTGCRPDGSTFDGILPFTVPNDFSTPNEAYFARADRILRLAAQYGFLVMLNPAEAIGWLSVMQSNGVDKSRAYGQFLGRRYANFDNIVWLHGNDYNFEQLPTAEMDAVTTAVALGIKDFDNRHLQTVHLYFPVSSSLEDANWAPLIQLNAAYTYELTYMEILKDYNRPDFLPTFMVEASYEFEQNRPEFFPGIPQVLRRQEYWSNLSGATGQLYGNHYTWAFFDGWKDQLDTPGAVQMAYVTALFGPRAWYDLVPDQDHTVVTSGFGTFGSDDYVTAARTPDGKLVMAYVPSARTLTVDMSKLSGTVTAKWYDPTAGTFTDISGSPFANAGSHNFTTPGNNSGGDGDWVLVLEASVNATLVKPGFTASSLIGGPVLVGGVESTGLARGPAFQLFNPAGVLQATQFALNPDFRSDLSFVLGNFDVDGADEVLVGGRETTGLARGAAYQVFETNGALKFAQFALNPDFVNVSFSSLNVGNNGVLACGRETGGLARGPAYQAFDAGGSLVRTQFVLNPDFTADNSCITTNLDGVAGDEVIVGGRETTGLARGPAFQLFGSDGTFKLTQFALNANFRETKSAVVDVGGIKDLVVSGRETLGLGRGPAYQVFDSNGNFVLTRFVLNSDFTDLQVFGANTANAVTGEEIVTGGTETSRLARGPAMQVWDKNGNLLFTRFVLNPDFTDVKFSKIDINNDGTDEILVVGRETKGLARGPAFQLFDGSGNLLLTKFVLNPDFSDLKVFSVDQGGSRQIGIGGTETSGLVRGPAYQVFDSSGNLSLTRFVLNPDF